MASGVAASSSAPGDASTTGAPRAASSRAVAAPIPRPAPVIATTFPATCLPSSPVTEASFALHTARPASTLSVRPQTRQGDLLLRRAECHFRAAMVLLHSDLDGARIATRANVA